MIQYKILETGIFHADGGAMFGAIPKKAWLRKYPEVQENCCRMAMNCLLVWNDSRVVLIDVGVGTKDLGKLSYYNFKEQKDILELIRKEGFEPEQITDVVLSHLHFDHCGACTKEINLFETEVIFRNARHWVGKLQLQSFLSPHLFEKNSYRLKDIAPVMSAGLIRLIENDFELFEGFQLKLFDGHTRGQIVVFIHTEKHICVFPGDVIPTKAHLSDDWVSAYDSEPMRSIDAKQKLKQILKGEKVNLVFYHDAYQSSYETVF